MRYLCVLVLIAACLGAADAAPRYTLTQIGGPSQMNLIPCDINEQGQVVGYYSTSSTAQQAFCWTKESGVRDLPSLGGDWGSAKAINDSGLVAGMSDPLYGGGHACMWAGGAPTDIHLQGNYASSAEDVNNAGWIVGACGIGDGRRSVGVVWKPDGSVLKLDSFGGPYCEAFAINERCEVAGRAYYPDYSAHAFVWREGAGMTDIGTLGGRYSIATAINDRGAVVGWSGLAASQGDRPFIWTPTGGMKDLGTLGGVQNGANDVNNYGKVVGWTGQDAYWMGEVAFVWSERTGMIDLNQCVTTEPDWRLNWARAINDAGQIICSAQGPFFASRAYLLTPVPSPVSIDIRPGDPANKINPRSNGSVPVAVIDAPEFDVASLDASSVRFAGARPFRQSLEDVDADGDADLLFQFRSRDLDLTSGSTEAALRAMTVEGDAVEGTDSVVLKP